MGFTFKDGYNHVLPAQDHIDGPIVIIHLAEESYVGLPLATIRKMKTETHSDEE